MTLAPIAIFAHNEERHIRSAVESVLRSFADQQEFEPVLYVLVNGSTDLTATIVRELADRHPEVRLVEIAIGDKSNAWNHYVFHVAPRADGHVFMDGDVRMGAGAGPEILRVLAQAPSAMAAVAMPTGGRNSKAYRRVLTAHPAVWGNLYALKEASLQMFRDKGVRLPVGHIGEDGLIGFLVQKDLDPPGQTVPGRIVAAERATVEYTPMRFYAPWDIRKYFLRRISYSARFYQFQFLGPRIKAGGVGAMPRHIVELYSAMDTYKRPLRIGPNLHFDQIAWKRMERARAAFESRGRAAED